MTASNKYMHEINVSFPRIIHEINLRNSSVISSTIKQLEDKMSYLHIAQYTK